MSGSTFFGESDLIGQSVTFRNGRFPVQILRLLYEAPGDPQVEKHSNQIWAGGAVSLMVTQSWPWYSQVADKKHHILHPH